MPRATSVYRLYSNYNKLVELQITLACDWNRRKISIERSSVPEVTIDCPKHLIVSAVPETCAILPGPKRPRILVENPTSEVSVPQKTTGIVEYNLMH